MRIIVWFFVWFFVCSIFVLPQQSLHAREIPMWKGIKKSASEKIADAKLIETVKKSGGRKNGAIRANQLGWNFIKQKNPDMAIKRFNQAWMLDPSNANIYWGFAIATHQQNRPLNEVMLHFQKAESKFQGNNKALVDLYADKGQVLGERKKYKDSILMFKKALKINSNHTRSRRGIVISAGAIGDTQTLAKYR